MPNYANGPKKGEFFQMYFALGEERSIRNLREKILQRDGTDPAMVTLEKWCTAERWLEKVREMDTQVSATNEIDLLKKLRVGDFVAKTEMRSMAGYLLRRVHGDLHDVKTTDKDAMTAVGIALEKVVMLVKAAAVEEGSVSDRTAQEATLTVSDENPTIEYMLANLRAAKTIDVTPPMVQ
jgi:hypothetical protein